MLSSSTPRASQKRKLRPKNRGNKKRKVTIQDDGSTTDSAADADESDSSDSDQIDWKKLEEELEENAAKANLTTINVKSILHHILADKRVIEYAKTVADSSGSYPEEVLQDTKLTRSKAKLLGQQPLPLEDNKEKEPKFLELNFNESSSDDEEYQPKEDEEDTSQASDEEFSTLSDAHSEIQSPYITATHTEDDTLTESDTSTLISTPTQNINSENIEKEVPNSSTKKELFKIPTVPNMPMKIDDRKMDLISSRTRSRLPMPNVEVEELEAQFQPPDSTALDFSVQSYDDPDEALWKAWLSDFTKPIKALGDTGDDELNDEDFNYMEAAAENDTEVETEELRDDKATRVTQKELQELFNELLLGYEQDNMANDVCYQYCDNWESDVNLSQSEAIFPQLTEAAKDLEITYKQRQQITSQMQQHVQLLAQICLLSCTNQTLRHEYAQCKQYIDELAMFHDKALENSEKSNYNIAAHCSTFCTPGISDAYRIINSLTGKKLATKNVKKMNSRNPVNDTIAELLAVEPYFATYVELIPEQGMIPEKATRATRANRMKFLSCEDNLLAIGMDQWRNKKEKFDLIAEHLLPTKTPRQLEVRVKNLCSSRGCHNPVAVVKKEKYLPDFHVKTNIVIPREISTVSLCQLPHAVWKRRLAPVWFLKTKKRLECKLEEEEKKRIVTKHEAKHDLFELAAKTPVSNSSIHDDVKCNLIKNPTSIPIANLVGGDQVLIAQQPIGLYPHLVSSTPLPVNLCSSHTQMPMRLCYSDPLYLLKCQGNPEVDRTKTNKVSGAHRKVNRSLCYTTDDMSVPFTSDMNTISQALLTVDEYHAKNKNDASIPACSSGYNNVLYDSSKKLGGRFMKNIQANSTAHSSAVQTNTATIEVVDSTSNIAAAIECNSSSITLTDLAKSSGAPLMITDIGLRTPTKTDSLDNFSTPVTQLFTNLPPSPKSFPLSLLSPSKPFQETSLNDVKQFLKTPQKVLVDSQESKAVSLSNTNVAKESSSEAFEREHLPCKALSASVPLVSMTEPKQNGVGSNSDLESVKAAEKNTNEETESLSLHQLDESTLPNAVEGKPTNFHPGDIASVTSIIATETITVSTERISSLSCCSGPVDSVTSLTCSVPVDSIMSLSCCSGPVESILETEHSEVNRTEEVSLVDTEQKEHSEVSATSVMHKVNGNPATVQQKISTPKKVKTIKQKRPATNKNSFDYNERLKKKAQIFVKTYFNRVKETLENEPELLSAFFALLQSDSQNRLSKLESYYRVADLLADYPELVDNFAGFLEQHEARHVGKFEHWLIYDSIVHFHLSCEHYFLNTPGWYAKINQRILEVMEKERDPFKIVDMVTPLFRGNQDITNQFIRLFPDLPPPMCDDDEFEVIDFAAVSSGSKEIDDFEEIAYQPPDGEHSLQIHDDQKCRKKSESVGGGSLKFPRLKSSTNIAASKLRQLATKRKKNKSKTRKSVVFMSDMDTGESLEADSSGHSSMTTTMSSEEHLTDGEMQETLKTESAKKCLEVNQQEASVTLTAHTDTNVTKSVRLAGDTDYVQTLSDKLVTDTNVLKTDDKNSTILESTSNQQELLNVNGSSEIPTSESHLADNTQTPCNQAGIVGSNTNDTELLHSKRFSSFLVPNDPTPLKRLSVERNHSTNDQHSVISQQMVDEKPKQFELKHTNTDEKLTNEVSSNQIVKNGCQSTNGQSNCYAIDFAVVSSTSKSDSDDCVLITDSKDRADDEEVGRIMAGEEGVSSTVNHSEAMYSCTPVVEDAGLLESENAQFNISSAPAALPTVVAMETDVFGQELTFDSSFAGLCHTSSTNEENGGRPTSRGVEKRSVTPRRLPKSEIITLERREKQTVKEFHAATEDDFPSNRSVYDDREGRVITPYFDDTIDAKTKNDVEKEKERKEIEESDVKESDEINHVEASPNYLGSSSLETSITSWDKDTDRLLLTIVMQAGEVNQAVMDEIFQKLDEKFTKTQIKDRLDFLLESFDDCDDDVD